MSLSFSLKQIYTDYKKLIAGHSWTSISSKRAAKVGIAVFVSVLIADKMNLGMPYWAAMSAIFTLQSTTTASSFKMGLLYRTGGTFAGAVIGLLLLGFCIQNYPVLYTVLFIELLLSFYLRYRSEHPQFWTFLGITIFLVLLYGNDSTPPDTVVFVFNRCSEIIIGTVTSCLIDFFICPEHASIHYKNAIQDLKSDYCNVLRQTFCLYLKNTPDEFCRCMKNLDKLINDFNKIRSLSFDAELESRIIKDSNNFIPLNELTLKDDIEDLKEFINKTDKRAKHKFHFLYEGEIKNIFNMLDNYLQREANGKIQRAKIILEKTRNLLFTLEHAFKKNKQLGIHKNFDAIEIFTFYEFTNIIKNYVLFLTNISNAEFKINKPLNSFENAEHQDRLSDFSKYSFFTKNMFIHKPTLHYSIQGSLIIILVVWLWKFLEIPGGNISIAVAVFVVILPDTNACYTKGLMRFIGCAVGGALGLIFLFMQIQSTFLMCIITFCVIYLFAYLQTGGPNISYLGRQAGYGFVIAVFPQSHPATSIEGIINRFIGIFFGIACAWFLRWFFWNEDISKNYIRQTKNIRKVLLTSFIVYKKIKNDPNSRIILRTADVSSAIISLKTLNYNNEISQEIYNHSLEFLNHINQLFYRLDNLLNTNREYLIKFYNINPKITDLLFKIIREISGKFSEQNFITIREDLNLLNEILEEYPEVLRNIWKNQEKTFSEKQANIHIFIIIRRIYRRLNIISELQQKIQNTHKSVRF